MPGITIIGDSRNAARNRPTSLPAEARSLSRMLRLLKSPETAAVALNQSLKTLSPPEDLGQAATLGRVRQQVSQSIQQMREVGWDTLADRYAEYNMALAIESVLQDSSSFAVAAKNSRKENTTWRNSNAPKPKRTDNNIPEAVAFSESQKSDDESIIGTDVSSVIATNALKSQEKNNTSSLSPLSKDSNDRRAPRNSSQTAVARRLLPLVSDSSTIEASEASQQEEEEQTRDSASQQIMETSTEEPFQDAQEEIEMGLANAARYLWSIILESLHLQVASRTTRVWGRKKIYEVYELARPMQDTCTEELPALRRRLETECCSIFDGVLRDASDCRVYVTLQNLAIGSSGSSNQRHTQGLFVQIHLGKLLDLQDERNRSVSGEKKKKAEREFVAQLVPGSKLFALTASRSPSRSKFTPYILTVLENILTETTNMNHAASIGMTKTAKKAALLNDLAVKRFGELSGTEPLDLLRAARAATEGEAVGRFALMAEKDQSNPIADLHTAATADLLGPANSNASETTRVHVGSVHPSNPEVAKAAATIARESQGAAALAGSNRSGDNLWVDHTVKQGQSRKRAREDALGRPQDCPSLQRMCWKWAGKTNAAAACWLDDDDDVDANIDQDKSTTELVGLPTTDFKCAVVMKGENVMQGLQALMDAGLVEGPLPDFIRDAPSMGTNVIRVNYGSFAAADTPFEEV